MKKITRHANMRMIERANLTNRINRKEMFRQAVQNGKSPQYYETRDIKLYNYLTYTIKNRYNAKIKVYKDYIYIYKNGKLITMFILPDCFKRINTNRNFIGIELDKEYFEIAEKRLNNY